MTHTMTHLGITWPGPGPGPRWAPGEWLSWLRVPGVLSSWRDKGVGSSCHQDFPCGCPHPTLHPSLPSFPHCSCLPVRAGMWLFLERRWRAAPQVGSASLIVRDSVGRALCWRFHSLVTAAHSKQKGAQFPSVMLAFLVFCLCLQDFIHLSATPPAVFPKHPNSPGLP